MASPESGGFIDKAINTGEKFNKITLIGAGAAFVAGSSLGMPWLAAAAIDAAILDIVGLVAFSELKNKRAN
jgi:hypothetical protein